MAAKEIIYGSKAREAMLKGVKYPCGCSQGDPGAEGKQYCNG